MRNSFWLRGHIVHHCHLRDASSAALLCPTADWFSHSLNSNAKPDDVQRRRFRHVFGDNNWRVVDLPRLQSCPHSHRSPSAAQPNETTRSNYPQEVSSVDRKKLKSNEVFYPDDTINAQRWQSNTNWEPKNTNSDTWKGIVQWSTDLFLHNCRVLVDFVWFLINYTWISLFFSAKVNFGCSSLVVQNRRIPLENGHSLLQYKEVNSIIFLFIPIEMI